MVMREAASTWTQTFVGYLFVSIHADFGQTTKAKVEDSSHTVVLIHFYSVSRTNSNSRWRELVSTKKFWGASHAEARPTLYEPYPPERMSSAEIYVIVTILFQKSKKLIPTANDQPPKIQTL